MTPPRWREGVASFGPAALAGAGVLVLLAACLALGGFDVARALAALVSGAMGSPATFATATLVRATPIILAGLAVALAFRAGILNIGADGQLLGGATAATAMALIVGDAAGVAGIAPVLAAGMGAGAACAWVPAWLRQRHGVLEVITTIMVNFVVLNLVSWLVRGPLQEPTGVLPQSAAIAPMLELPRIVPGTRLHAGFLLALVLAVGLHHFFARSATGFRVRVLGANPHAASVAARVDVAHLSTRVFLWSGALAGLAGAVQVTGVTRALYDNLSPGYGFTAVAVALLAGLHPLGIVASGIFLGGLAAGAAAMQRDAGVPAVLVSVLEAAVILAVVVWRARPVRPGAAAT